MEGVMARQKSDLIPVMIRLEPGMKEKLEAIAEKEERSLAQTIRYAIRKYVADE